MKTLIFLLCAAPLSWALYTSSDDVIELNDRNFETRVLKSDELWIVEFYAPWCGHCKAFASEYKKAATALKGVVRVGAINCDDEKGLAGRYGIKGFPTVKIFGSNKNSPSDFQGQRTAQGVVDEAFSNLKRMVNDRIGGGGSSYRRESEGDSGKQANAGPGEGADLVQLTDSNFDTTVMNSEDMWLVEFYAPWCGHCKSLAPEWARAATALKGKVKVAAVDATANQMLSQRYDIKGFPSIKMFPAGPKSASTVVEYDGPRDASGIAHWATDKLADNLPPPKVSELLSSEQLSETCASNKPVCILAIVPDLLDCDAKCRNNYLSIIADVSKKFRRQGWGWLWTQENAFSSLENTLSLGGSYFPIMAAVNVKKQVFARLKRPFTVDGISEFLSEVAYGRGSTEPMRGELPTIETRAAWDGKDAKKVDEKIEDVDVSDVQLDDDDTYKVRRKQVEL
jgi:protein disulfide-isomerase A6